MYTNYGFAGNMQPEGLLIQNFLIKNEGLIRR